MSARPPLPPIPGYLTNYVDVDLFAGYFATAQILTEFQPAITEAPSGGSVTVDLRTATGGLGDGLSATIPDGELVPAAPVVGSVAIPADTTMYLRLTGTTSPAANFYGNYLVDAVGGVASALTTLALVKQHKGITGTHNDATINMLIGWVSKWMQNIGMRRNILAQVITEEVHDATGRFDYLLLNECPIIQPPAVVLRYNGTVVDASTYEVDEENGELIQVSDGVGSPWAAGRRAYQADYWSGYPQTPEDLAEVATLMVVKRFLETSEGDGRFGLTSEILEPGGSAQYLVGKIPGAKETLDWYKHRRHFR